MCVGGGARLFSLCHSQGKTFHHLVSWVTAANSLGSNWTAGRGPAYRDKGRPLAPGQGWRSSLGAPSSDPACQLQFAVRRFLAEACAVLYADCFRNFKAVILAE